MKTITQAVHLHAKRNNYTGEYEYSVMSSEDMSQYGYTHVLSQEATFELPDNFNPIPAEIAMLRTVKDKILAEARVKANAIEEQISTLLCLEHKPATAAE